jgi:hypothetical protein
VTEALAHDLGVDAGREHVAGVRVPEVVEADSRERRPGNETVEELTHAVSVQGSAVRERKHEIQIGVPAAQHQPLLELGGAVATKRGDRLGIDVDRPTASRCLRVTDHLPTGNHRDRLAHDQSGRLEIDIGPTQSTQFGSTQPGQRSESQQRPVIGRRHEPKERCELARRPDVHLWRSCRRRGWR